MSPKKFHITKYIYKWFEYPRDKDKEIPLQTAPKSMPQKAGIQPICSSV